MTLSSNPQDLPPPVPRRIYNRLSAQLVAVVLASYVYVCMEWLFYVTKVSPLAALSRFEQLEVLFVTPLLVAAIGCTGVLVVWLLGRAAGSTAVGTVIRGIGWAPSAALLAVCVFLLIDNFTYTLFAFGVGSTTGWQRGAYALLVVGLFVLAWRRLVKWEYEAHAKPAGRAAAFLAFSLIFVSAVAATQQLRSAPVAPLVSQNLHRAPEELPNIIIFNTDGLEASHMSAYGYGRETTPTIEKIAHDSLLFENALHNGGHTTASNASILTGKLPLTTGLLAAGQILGGIDAYQHLPGLLGRLGYQSMYMGTRAFGDPFNLNLRDGFDWANGRRFSGARHLPAVPRRLAIAYSSEVYFLAQLYWRAAERLLHAAAIAPMVNPFLEVKKRTNNWNDERRVAETLAYIKRTRGPFFVHVHLMGTHPPLKPQMRVFSRDGGKNDDNRYDDAVLEFDGFVKRLVDTLESTGKLDKTLLIISSDHGKNWKLHRIPLLFRFPGRKPRGVIRRNAQLIDIAPTVLDYIGVEIPAWMDGESVLSSKLDYGRPIFAMTARTRDDQTFLETVTVTIRDQVFGLEIDSGNMTLTRIPGHTAGNPILDKSSAPRMKELLLEQLHRNGYEEEYIRAGGVPSAEPGHAGEGG